MRHGCGDLPNRRQALRARRIALCRREQFVRVSQCPILLQHFGGRLGDFQLKTVVHRAQGFC